MVGRSLGIGLGSESTAIAASSPIARAIREIAVLAGEATQCMMVAVYAERDGNGNLGLIDAVGVPSELLTTLEAMAWFSETADQEPIAKVVIDMGVEQGDPSLETVRSPRVYTGFAVCSLADAGTRVVMVIIAEHSQKQLSAAQGYCLQAYVAHIATLLVVDAGSATAPAGGRRTLDRRQSERLRLLESVAVHARDSIIITEAEPIDLPGPRIIYCNAAFTAATGYSEAEVLGKTPRVLQGPNTDPATRIKLREMLLKWQPIEIELLNYKKDGSEFWVELSIVPVADERGWFTHWVSVQRDITERKAADELKTRVLVAEVRNTALAAEIQERKRVEANLLYTASHDSLTGLRNRAFFMKQVETRLNQPDRRNGTFAILFLDLDRFKIVNDSLGHTIGDALLFEIAHRLTQCTRPQDVLARIGGDEFALLVDGTDDLAVAVDIAERIIEALRAPVRLSGQDVYPSCSIGVTQATPGTLVAEDLIREADIAMYRAKRSGRGDYAIFTESMRADSIAVLQLQTDLQRALEQQEFVVYYQPIVDPGDGRILGFEALLRWQHPTRGLIPPNEFVPMAEEMGLINEIDRRVVREACLKLLAWQRRFTRPDLHMSVNASAVELADPSYVDGLVTILHETGINPHMLEIEITEGLFLLPSAATSATLKAIRELGVKIGLDDFGTGYSSLSYINRYPIDTIKIDRSFISSMCGNAVTRVIVDLIVKLGTSLGVGIVAEGVETVQQAEMLIEMGCARVQGYLFYRPVTAEEVESIFCATFGPNHEPCLSG